MSKYDSRSLTRLSSIQEFSEYKDGDEAVPSTHTILRQSIPFDQKVEIIYGRSDDSVSLNTNDNYSISAVSCTQARNEYKDDKNNHYVSENTPYLAADESSVRSIFDCSTR